MSTPMEGSLEDLVSDEPLRIGDRTFRSRLILGSAHYPNPDVMLRAIRAAGVEVVTVAVRRVNLRERSPYDLLSLLESAGVAILPNTAGAYTAREAVLLARLAREAFGRTGSSWKSSATTKRCGRTSRNSSGRPRSWSGTALRSCRIRPTTPSWLGSFRTSGARPSCPWGPPSGRGWGS